MHTRCYRLRVPGHVQHPPWLTPRLQPHPVTCARQVVGKNGKNAFFTSSNSMYAYSPVDGTQLWTHSTQTAETLGAPAVSQDGEFVFAGTDESAVVGVFVGTGAQIWRTTTGGPVYSAPAVDKAGKTIFVTSHVANATGPGMTVMAVEAGDGSPVWNYTETSSPGADLCATPS